MKNLAFVSVLVLCLFCNSYSQGIDSLRNVVRKEGIPDTVRILALVELAYQLQSTFPDSSLHYASRANTLSEVRNYQKGQGRATRVIGNYHVIRTNYIESINLFEKALAYSKNAHDLNNVAKCYGNIGFVYGSQGNYEKAVEYHLRSLRIHEQLGNKQGVAYVHNNIAYVYESQGNNEKAREYYFSSLALLHELNDQPTIAVVELNIGVAYHEDGRYNEALEHLLKALRIFEALRDKHGLTYCYADLANLHIELKENDKGLLNLRKALIVAEEIRAQDGVAFIKELYAKYYSSISKYKLAYRYASESQVLSKDIGNLERWRNASRQKYIACTGLGKYKEALQNYELYIKLRDSLKNEEIYRRSLSLEYAMKEEKMKMQQERNELQVIAERERQKRISITIAGISSILLGAGLFGIYRLWVNSTRKQMAAVRERISRDIHDSMGSNLSTINVLSDVAVSTLANSSNGSKAAELLSKIGSISRQVMESVDEIVWSIDPHHSLEEVITRMRMLGSQLEEQKITFFFFVEGDPAKCNLDLGQRNDFYLIYKEAITNISKYASCKNVYVNLSITQHTVNLVIADDGKGFHMDTQSGGRGLQNMQVRSKNLSGQMKVWSEINKGTILELEFLA